MRNSPRSGLISLLATTLMVIAATTFLSPRAAHGAQWFSRADMLTARRAEAATVNGKIYVMGGWGASTSSVLTLNEEYDPGPDRWMPKAAMPAPRYLHTATAVDGKIYVIGGVASAAPPMLTTNLVYDPVADS